jgi:hypothetical protein
MTDYGASGAAKTIEWWKDKFKTLKLPNAVNCAYLVLEEMQDGPRRRDWNADTVANALLAFKRLGVEDGQPIYVESEWITKFVQYLIDQGLKYSLEHSKDEKCKIVFPMNFNLREDLPSHLRGKFSMTP